MSESLRTGIKIASPPWASLIVNANKVNYMQHISATTRRIAPAIGAPRRHSALRILAASLVASAMLMQSAAAQDTYPSRPVRLVVAFAPGGITDIVARLVGEKLSERLGQPVVIDNKGGAAGALGAKLVSAADPDGYTLLVTTTAVAIGAAASPSAVDPRTQLVPIAIAASAPTIVCAKGPTNAKNLMEFVSEQKDGLLTYASSGAGTVEHLTAAYVLKGVSGISATHVPYRSGGEAVNALFGGHVNLSTTPVGTAMSFIQDGKLKVLGVASHKRLASMPDIPTFGESGLPDVDNASWVSIFGPPGLPGAVAQRINTEVNHVLRQPEFRERLTKMGFDLYELSQPEFVKQMQAEVDKWGVILKETGITLN
jgi:tripartite-type tricarboxylate transporter receptor subunit TctC